MMSFITDPFEEEMTPIVFGVSGSAFLFSKANKPSVFNLFFSWSNAS
jgi:hypothetical protein